MFDLSCTWNIRVESGGDEWFPADGVAVKEMIAGLDRGTVGADGTKGDSIEMKFDRKHALVLYFPPGTQETLRLRFPMQGDARDAVDSQFCDCCGIQLGSGDDILGCSMSRIDGLRVFCDLIDQALGLQNDLEWVPYPPSYPQSGSPSPSHSPE